MRESRKSNRANVFILMLFLLFIAGGTVRAQCDTLVVMFYNVENFFDTRKDSVTRDGDFQPDGLYHWNYSRFKRKTTSIARAILSANGWNAPALVGLCEIENDAVMKQLLYGGGLINAGYDYVHYESPDPRGIDVALLYNRFVVKILEQRAVSLSNHELGLRTRDALYVKMIYAGFDTLHVVVNHWPSKYGGEKASEPRRNYAAATVRQLCDSIMSSDNNARIILMGDLNDDARANAVYNILGAKKHDDKMGNLVNLSFMNKKLGSYKFRGEWSCIDHIIISRSLWNGECPPLFKVVDLPFLLEEDEAFSGVKPLRTYLGPKYIGGYSDHLPIIGFITLIAKQ